MERNTTETSVTLFTQDGCVDSGRVRACFVASGVPFVERNVSGDDDAVQALAATGVFATPLVASEGRAILGANLPKLADALGFACRCPAGRRGVDQPQYSAT